MAPSRNVLWPLLLFITLFSLNFVEAGGLSDKEETTRRGGESSANSNDSDDSFAVAQGTFSRLEMIKALLAYEEEQQVQGGDERGLQSTQTDQGYGSDQAKDMEGVHLRVGVVIDEPMVMKKAAHITSTKGENKTNAEYTGELN